MWEFDSGRTVFYFELGNPFQGAIDGYIFGILIAGVFSIGNKLKGRTAMSGGEKEIGGRTVESEVWRPGRWPALAVGAIFMLVGAVGFLVIRGDALPGVGFWIAKVLTAVVALLGGAVVAWAIGSIVWPAHIRHAAPGVLPDVPKEPVVREGLVVHGRLTHELHEEAEGWQFRPAARLWRNDKGFLYCFGLPFSVVFAGLMAWALHSRFDVFFSWPGALLCAATATAVSGGSVWLSLGMLMRAGYRRLPRLSILRNGDAIELDSPEEPNVEKADLLAGLKWVFLGDSKRQQLSIPRAWVAAVQLCPWKYKSASEICWAVQGLLVLTSPESAAYHRLPILLTLDYAGAARLMQKLAQILQVPYLFCADAEGWKAEELRARERPPMRAGGLQS